MMGILLEITDQVCNYGTGDPSRVLETVKQSVFPSQTHIQFYVHTCLGKSPQQKRVVMSADRFRDMHFGN